MEIEDAGGVPLSFDSNGLGWNKSAPQEPLFEADTLKPRHDVPLPDLKKEPAMLTFPRRAARWTAAALAILLSAPSAFAAPVKREAPGADSPQAVIARLEKAAQAKDLPGMAACLAPEDRTEITKGMLLAATMMVAFAQMGPGMADQMAEGMSTLGDDSENPKTAQEKAKEKAERDKQTQEAQKKVKEMETQYRAILKKNGLPDFFSEDGQKKADPDKADALLQKVDQIALLDDLMGFLEKMDTGENQEPEKPFELPGKVTDYKIQGDRATAKAGKETVDFVKVGGRWFMKAPEKKGEPAGTTGGR
jgi:hypothetical protein